MIPEITITCSTGKVFINNITVEQYKKYAALMEKNGSDKITDALFFNKRIIQEIFGNRMSLDELGEVDVIEFLTASKGIHFIMQDIVSDALLNIVETEPIERVILSILVDTFISKISFPMQPGPEIGSISDA